MHSDKSDVCQSVVPQYDESDLFVLIGHKCGENNVNININFLIYLFEAHLCLYSLVIRHSLVLRLYFSNH